MGGWSTAKWWLLAGLLVACGRPQASASGPVAEAGAPSAAVASIAVVPSATDGDAPYRCARDEDCVTTCRFGAVSRAWWGARDGGGADRGCEDGCASKGLVARCEGGGCATYDTRFGRSQRADDCTRRAASQ